MAQPPSTCSPVVAFSVIAQSWGPLGQLCPRMSESQLWIPGVGGFALHLVDVGDVLPKKLSKR